MVLQLFFRLVGTEPWKLTRLDDDPARVVNQRQRQKPPRNDVNLPGDQKKNRFSHAVCRRIGVMAFIA